MKITSTFNRLFKGIAFASVTSLITLSAHAQMESGNAFMKGKYVEIGVCENGAFGSTVDVPSGMGYHPRDGVYTNKLGFVADPDMDGFSIGSPSYIGDYFLPGAPQEGWDIQVNGVRSQAWRGNTPYGSFTGDLTGANVSVGMDGARKWALWQGSAGNLAISQKTILDTNKVYFVCEVVLKNTGSTPLVDIYYNRTVDPDNEAAMTSDGCWSYSTTNTIEYQPSFDGTDDDDKALVSSVGDCFDSYLGLGAVDCRAKAYIIVWDGLMPNQPLDDIYNDGTVYITEKGEGDWNDTGIGVVFNIGTLNPGDSTTLAYAYILRQADLDSAFATLGASWAYEGSQVQSGDTIVKCAGGTIDIDISGGGAYIWGDWTPTTGLSKTAGRQNTITVGYEPITYRVIGTTPICSNRDTMYLTVVPDFDSVYQTKSICQGQTYNFLGDELYRSGTYYNILQTVSGCDSVIELKLTVNPTPDIAVVARETEICEGEEALLTLGAPSSYANYQWYRNGSPIPGATQHNLATTQPGVYSVTGVTDKGCNAESRNIQVVVNPAASGTIVSVSAQDVCFGDTVTLKSDNKPGYQYSWQPEAYFRYTGGNLSSEASGIIPNTAEVHLISMNEYGCRDFDTVVVQAHPCCEIYIPSAFTPNNDGLNDNFLPMLRPGQVVVALQIFARNGQIVYDNNEPLKGWNGSMNNSGDQLNAGVYMYRFIYTCTDGEVYESKGDVTLIR
jgi:gliding motility-associated-like protein